MAEEVEVEGEKPVVKLSPDVIRKVISREARKPTRRREERPPEPEEEEEVEEREEVEKAEEAAEDLIAQLRSLGMPVERIEEGARAPKITLARVRVDPIIALYYWWTLKRLGKTPRDISFDEWIEAVIKTHFKHCLGLDIAVVERNVLYSYG